MKKLWHLYFAKKWRKLDHPYKIIYTMYKQADFWLSMFGTSYVRKRFQYINFDLGHHCKSSEHNRWIKTNGNRYSFWNAYTRYTYMLRKLVINQAKMLHCFEECASNFPQKILSTRLCGRQNLVLLASPTPHMWKAEQTHFSRPSGRAPSLYLFSFSMLMVFLLSIFLSLSLYDHASLSQWQHCEIGVSDYGAVLAGKNLAVLMASSYPGCPTFIQDR